VGKEPDNSGLREELDALPGVRRMDEAELMELIFAHLDPENPRVCEGIDFDRLVILAPRHPQVLPEPPEPEPEPEPTIREEPWPKLDASGWIGRGWTDVIGPIPAAVLDRPQLSPAQRELLTRARKRVEASVNLRHLDRERALAHLELQIHLCRDRRLRFCRVITGKGIDSKTEPVLKRAVIEWCREQDVVLGWAPELDQHGEWGAMVVELRGGLR
jgi:DNA-nicking Smr family endonuclease